MSPYVVEQFTEAEESVLRRYVTNLDRPVFALVNLPEVVKGALFARYSRSSKSLRRLFLDEFVDELEIGGDETIDATMGLARAEELYERVFFEYGDDSVAQLGGVHLACEQASNLLTKVLERGRLMAYLEQSTRYIGYDARLPTGHYRYHRPPRLLESPLGARYVGEMDRMFDSYGTLLRRVEAWLAGEIPRDPADSDLVHRRAIRAKALDAVRGLLPAGALSNVGIYGTGQSYELLLLHLANNPLTEAREYGTMMLEELRKVIPSFLTRVDREDRGVAWSEYLARTRSETAELVGARDTDVGGGEESSGARGVTLVDFDPAGEEKILAAIVFGSSGGSEHQARLTVQGMSPSERKALLAAYVGRRDNRRHRPGRAFERTDYRFEVVSDYGAFRDLQRHRMLSIEWQPLSTSLGYEISPEIEGAGLRGEYEETLARSAELHGALKEFGEDAGYAVALAFRIRYVMQMNAREAMHVLELRSGTQGHPTYRRIAQEMHRAIAEVAGHGAIAETMQFVDHGSADLERLEAERKIEAKRAKILLPFSPGQTDKRPGESH